MPDPEAVGRTRKTGGSSDGSGEAFNARARRRLMAAAPQWERPAVVVTNLEGFVGIQTARLMRRHGVPVVALSDRPRDALSRTRSVAAVFDAGPDGRDTARVLGEIVFWTVLGLGGIFMAFHTIGRDLGMIWWWMGSIVWIAGVSAAVLGGYRRGLERGDL